MYIYIHTDKLMSLAKWSSLVKWSYNFSSSPLQVEKENTLHHNTFHWNIAEIYSFNKQ